MIITQDKVFHIYPQEDNTEDAPGSPTLILVWNHCVPALTVAASLQTKLSRADRVHLSRPTHQQTNVDN